MRTWAKSSLYLSVALIVVGFLLIYLAWNGAAEKDFIQGQFPYLLSGGVSGIAFILCGLTLAATQSFPPITFGRRLYIFYSGHFPTWKGVKLCILQLERVKPLHAIYEVGIV